MISPTSPSLNLSNASHVNYLAGDADVSDHWSAGGPGRRGASAPRGGATLSEKGAIHVQVLLIEPGKFFAKPLVTAFLCLASF